MTPCPFRNLIASTISNNENNLRLDWIPDYLLY